MILLKTLKSKTLINAIWLISEKVFNMSVNLIVISLLARYLGPENYGTYNYAVAIVTMLAIISTMGIETLSIKSIVQKEEKEGTILFTHMVMRVIGGLFQTILSVIVISILASDNKILHLMVLFVSISSIVKSLEVIEYWIQAKQKSKLSSSVRMVSITISAILKILFVAFKFHLFYLAIIYLLEATLISIGLVIVYLKYRTEKSKWQFKFRFAIDTFSQSWYMIVSGLMVAAYTQFDKVLIANLANEKQLGFYTAAQSISNLWVFIPMAIITSIKPIIMKNKLVNDHIYNNSIQQLFSLVSAISIACSVGVFVFSDMIIKILYGSAYSESASILTISIWAGCFSILGTIRGVWLACEKLQKYSVYYLGMGAIVSVASNIILIPVYGAKGAAISILITEVVTGLIAPLCFSETRKIGFMAFKGFLFVNILNRK